MQPFLDSRYQLSIQVPRNGSVAADEALHVVVLPDSTVTGMGFQQYFNKIFIFYICTKLSHSSISLVCAHCTNNLLPTALLTSRQRSKQQCMHIAAALGTDSEGVSQPGQGPAASSAPSTTLSRRQGWSVHGKHPPLKATSPPTNFRFITTELPPPMPFRTFPQASFLFIPISNGRHVHRLPGRLRCPS